MTREEFAAMIDRIDPANAPYIIADPDISGLFDRICSWEYRRPETMSVLNDGEDKETKAQSIVKMLKNDLERRITMFDSTHLTPANAKVGDGATVIMWSDRHAGTIVKVTKSTITIQRDKATLAPDFKPEFILGGFSAHCTNQGKQSYTYEPDERGTLTTIHWSRKYNRYGTPGNLTASRGRHEFYDYNF